MNVLLSASFYFVCFSIMSQHKLREQNIKISTKTFPTMFSHVVRLSFSGFDEVSEAERARETGSRSAERQDVRKKNSQTIYALMLLS